MHQRHSSTRVVIALALAVSGAGLIAAGTWTADTVASTGDVGFYNALAFDQAGLPAIAYSDQTNDDLRFAHFDGTNWTTSLVDAAKNVATGIDLAYDPSGKPAISYGWNGLKFAEWTGTSWSIQTLVKGAANDVTSLAYLGSTPYIALAAGSGKAATLQLAYRTNGKWIVEVVEKAAAKYKSLAFDTSGNPVIAYSDDINGDGQLDTLKVARKAAGKWTVSVLETGVVGYGVYASLAFDGAGNPAIAHGNGTVRYLSWTGQWSAGAGAWSASVVDGGPFAGGESLRFSQGPLVSWRQTAGTGNPDVVKLALGTLQVSGVYSWTPVTSVYSTIPPETIAFRTSLALDATGQPAVSACLGSARNLLYLHQAP
jgi:hypothetical protein